MDRKYPRWEIKHKDELVINQEEDGTVWVKRSEDEWIDIPAAMVRKLYLKLSGNYRD